MSERDIRWRDQGRWGEANLYDGIFSSMDKPIELPQALIREHFPR